MICWRWGQGGRGGLCRCSATELRMRLEGGTEFGGKERSSEDLWLAFLPASLGGLACRFPGNACEQFLNF